MLLYFNCGRHYTALVNVGLSFPYPTADTVRGDRRAWTYMVCGFETKSVFLGGILRISS